MQYAMQNSQGFKVTEIVRMKSKSGTLTFSGDVNAAWKDASLKAVTTDVADRFLSQFGINLKKKYDGKLKAWQKDIQARMDKLESKILKDRTKFEKAAKKKPPTGPVVQKFADDQNAEQTNGMRAIEDHAQTSYKKMLGDMVNAIRKVTVSGMGDTGKLLKNDKGAIAWSVIKFLVVAAAITVAVLALPPVGLTLAFGVGVAALVTKGLATTTSFIKDCIDFAKQFNTAIAKVNTQVDGATANVNKAIADMRTAQTARDSMTLKLAAANTKLEEVKKKATGESKEKAVTKAVDRVKKAQADMVAFEKAIGGNPDMVLSQLEAARKALKAASDAMPVKTKSGSGGIGDIMGTVDDAVSMFDEIAGGL